MDYQNLMPQQAQPISRIPSDQLPTELAELSEEELGGGNGSNEDIESNELNEDNRAPSIVGGVKDVYKPVCSYDGDNAE